MRVYVFEENTAMASSIKRICSPMCACVHIGNIYWINVSIDGRSKKDKNWLYFVGERKISYFGLVRNLIRHLISPNQDDLSYSARPSFPATKSCKLPNTVSLAVERHPVQTSLCGSRIAAAAVAWTNEGTHLIYGFLTRNPSWI